MNNSKQYNLFQIIITDMFKNSKLPLLLLILILISSMFVIIITHHTRQLIIKHEKIMIEKNILNIEWRNLTLKEKILSNHERIAYIAIKKLNMKYVEPLQVFFIDYFNEYNHQK